MPKTSEDTRSRILEAAAAEFARHGIAGARVNRIAEAASANKERIYAYFGDKRRLFDAVIARGLAEAAEATPLDADDIPGSVGRMSEIAPERERLVRLAAWARLEGAQGALPDDDPRLESYRAKLEEIRTAQRMGAVDPSWDPVDLLALLTAVATAWTQVPDELCQLAGPDGASRDARRFVVEEAVRRLIDPRH